MLERNIKTLNNKHGNWGVGGRRQSVETKNQKDYNIVLKFPFVYDFFFLSVLLVVVSLNWTVNRGWGERATAHVLTERGRHRLGIRGGADRRTATGRPACTTCSRNERSTCWCRTWPWRSDGSWRRTDCPCRSDRRRRLKKSPKKKSMSVMWTWLAGPRAAPEYIHRAHKPGPRAKKVFKESKKRFVIEYWYWSHLKDCSLDDFVLEFYWSRERIS